MERPFDIIRISRQDATLLTRAALRGMADAVVEDDPERRRETDRLAVAISRVTRAAVDPPRLPGPMLG
ncbi:MAG: hypothetical protein AB7F35_20270 [Acetobacteraceae bacterium]